MALHIWPVAGSTEKAASCSQSSASHDLEALPNHGPVASTACECEPGTGDNGLFPRPTGDDTGIHPPDAGWRPWKVMVGCFYPTVAVYGLLSSIGLFQTYWHKHQLAGYTESDISWIMSMFGFMDCFVGGPAGLVFDRYGTTAPTTIAFSIVNQWFREMEGIATGCVTVGAALGGIFFSLVLQALFERFVWRNAMLTLASTMAGLMVLANALVDTNVKGRPTAMKGVGLNTASLRRLSKSVKFWLAAYAVFARPRSVAYELVLFIQWGSTPTYAVSVGVESNQFYLMMSYNITLIGNPSTGAILEKYGSHGLVALILLTGFGSVTALRWLYHGRRWIVKDKI
ncbi:hypothetical protein OQA88_6723 [Cercophora sp. LCS_1]